MHTALLGRKRLVAGVQLGILRTRDGIVWIAVHRRVFIDKGGLCALLSGEMFELRHPRVRIFVRIIDHRDWLVLLFIQRLELEVE